MRRPAGVVVAAVVLGLIALFGIFAEVLILGVSLLVQSPVMPHLPAMRATLLVTNAAVLCFFLFCEWAVVGLFRMRRWARIAMLIVSGVMFCVSAILCVGMILIRVPALPVTKGPSPVSLQAVFVGMSVFYGLLSLIGAWWLVYFNLRPVRAAFAAADPRLLNGQAVPASETSAWRVVLVVWAWLMLAGALFFPWAIWTRLPVFLFGLVLHGAVAMAVLAAYATVQVFAGVGLLRRWKAGWYVTLAWQIYSIAYSATMLLPGTGRRFAEYQQQLANQWSGLTVTSPHATVFVSQRPFMEMMFLLGLVVVLVLTWVLIRERGDFLGRESPAV